MNCESNHFNGSVDPVLKLESVHKSYGCGSLTQSGSLFEKLLHL